MDGEATGESRGNPALRRKAGAARRGREVRTPSAARSLRRALAGAAEGRLRLALTVPAVTEKAQTQEDLIAALDAEGLVLLLEGPDGRVGAAVIESTLVAGLVQHQTTGRITAPEARRSTDTDAAIVAPLIEGTLDRARADLDGGPDAGWTDGLQFGARLDGLRALGIALQAPTFRLFRLTAELAGGLCRGEIELALPEPPQPVSTAAPPPSADLAATVGAATVELQAILHRLSMPISEVGALAAGTRLMLPAASLNQVELCARAGSSVASVRLGQIEGMRAVRLPGAAAASRGEESDHAEGDMPSCEAKAQVAPRAQPTSEETGSGGTQPPDLPDLPPLEIQ